MATSSRPVRVAIIGSGAVSDYHHVPGIRLDSRAELVAACDSSQELLEQRRRDWNIDWTTNRYEVLKLAFTPTTRRRAFVRRNSARRTASTVRVPVALAVNSR